MIQRKENLKHYVGKGFTIVGVNPRGTVTKPKVQNPTCTALHYKCEAYMIISALQMLWATPNTSLWTWLPRRPTNPTTWMEARKGTENIYLAWQASCQIHPNKHLISLATLHLLFWYLRVDGRTILSTQTTLFHPPIWAWKCGRAWVLQT